MTKKLSKITKKALSVILCLIMMLSTMLIGVSVPVGAVSHSSGKRVFFNSTETGWEGDFYLCLEHSDGSLTTLSMTQFAAPNMYLHTFAQAYSDVSATYVACDTNDDASVFEHYTGTTADAFTTNVVLITPSSSQNGDSITVTTGTAYTVYTDNNYAYISNGTNSDGTVGTTTVEGTVASSTHVASSSTKLSTASSANAYLRLVNGSYAKLTATPASGYEFQGWYKVANATAAKAALNDSDFVTMDNPFEYITSTEIVYYVAKFGVATVKYDVNVSAGDGGTVSPSGTIQAGSNPTSIIATPNDGYVFDGWTVTDGANVADATSATTSVTATSTGTVTANFAKVQTVDYSAIGDNVAISSATSTLNGVSSDFVSGAQLRVGSQVTITASVDAGFSLTESSWKNLPDGATFNSDYTQVTFNVESGVDYNIMVTASAKPLVLNFTEGDYGIAGNYTVTFNGTVYKEPSQLEVYAGDIVTLEVEVADETYTLSSISAEGGILEGSFTDTSYNTSISAWSKASGSYTYTVGTTDDTITINYAATTPVWLSLDGYGINGSPDPTPISGYTERLNVYFNSTFKIIPEFRLGEITNIERVSSLNICEYNAEDETFTLGYGTNLNNIFRLTITNTTKAGLTNEYKQFIRFVAQKTEVQESYLNLQTLYNTCLSEEKENYEDGDGLGPVWTTFANALKNAQEIMEANPDLPQASDTDNKYQEAYEALLQASEALKTAKRKTGFYVVTSTNISTVQLDVADVDAMFSIENADGTVKTEEGFYDMKNLGQVEMNGTNYYVHYIDYMGTAKQVAFYSPSGYITSTFIEEFTFGKYYLDCRTAKGGSSTWISTYTNYVPLTVTVNVPDGTEIYQSENYDLTQLDVAYSGSFVNSGAQCNLDSYSIAYPSDLSTFETVNTPSHWASLEYGDHTARITASIKDAVTGESLFTSSGDVTLDVIKIDKITVAEVEGATVKVSYTNNEGEDITIKEGESNFARNGTEITLEVITDSGCDFEYFLINGEKYTEYTYVLADKDIDVKAVISRIVDVDVVFDQNVTLTAGKSIDIKGLTDEDENVVTYTYIINVMYDGEIIFTEEYTDDGSNSVTFTNDGTLENGVYYAQATLKGLDADGAVIISGVSRQKPIFVTDDEVAVIDTKLTATYDGVVYEDNNSSFIVDSGEVITFNATVEECPNAVTYKYQFYKSYSEVTSVSDLKFEEIATPLMENAEESANTFYDLEITFNEQSKTYYYVVVIAYDENGNQLSIESSSLYNGYIAATPIEADRKLYFCMNTAPEGQQWNIGDAYPVTVTNEHWDRKNVTMYLDPEDQYAEKKGVYMGYFTEKEIQAIREYGCTFTQGDNEIIAYANPIVQEGYIYTVEPGNAEKSSIDSVGIWGEYDVAINPSRPDNWNDVVSDSVVDNTIVYYDNSITQWREVWISCWNSSNTSYAFRMNKLDSATGFDNIYYFDLNGADVTSVLGEDYLANWLADDEQGGFLFLDRGGFYDEENGKYVLGYGKEYAQSINVHDFNYSFENSEALNEPADTSLWTTFTQCSAPVYFGEWYMVNSTMNATSFKMRSYARQFTDLYDNYINNTVKRKTVNVYIDTHYDDALDSAKLYVSSTSEYYTYNGSYFHMSRIAESSIYYTSVIVPYTGTDNFATYFAIDKVEIQNGDNVIQLPVAGKIDSNKIISSGELWLESSTSDYSASNGTYTATVNNISSETLSGLVNIDSNTKRVYWANDGYTFTAAATGSKDVYLHYNTTGDTLTFEEPVKMTYTETVDHMNRRVYYADVPATTKAMYFSQGSESNSLGTTTYKFANTYGSDAGTKSWAFYCNGTHSSDTYLALYKYDVTQAPSITNYYSKATLTVDEVVSVTPNNYSGTLYYESSDNSIATVDSNGKVTALKYGDVTITITAVSKTGLSTAPTFNDAVSVTCQVEVCSESLTIDTGNDNDIVVVEPGSTSNIELKYIFNDNTYESGFTFTSANTGVATVTNDGVVTGVGKGFTTITVKYGSEELATIAVASDCADVMGYSHSITRFASSAGGYIDKSSVFATVTGGRYTDDSTGYVTIDGSYYKLIYVIPGSTSLSVKLYATVVKEGAEYEFMNWTNNNSQVLSENETICINSADVAPVYCIANFAYGAAENLKLSYEYYEFDDTNNVSYNPNKVSLKEEPTTYEVTVKVPKSTLYNTVKLKTLYEQYAPHITSDYFEYVANATGIQAFADDFTGDFVLTSTMDYVARAYTVRVVNPDGEEKNFSSYYQQKTYLLNAADYTKGDALYGYIWYDYDSKGNKVVLSTNQYYQLRITQNRTLYVMIATSPTASVSTLINEPQYNLINSNGTLKMEMNMLIENYVPEGVEVLMTGAVYYFTDANDSVTVPDDYLASSIEAKYADGSMSSSLGVVINDGTYQVAGYKTSETNMTKGKFIFAPTTTYSTSSYRYYKVYSYIVYTTDGGETYSTTVSSPVIASVAYYEG